MTGKRFTLTYEKIGKHFSMGIVDHETKEPFDDTTYEFNQCSFKDSKDEMEDLCLLLNELHEDNQLLHKMNAEAIDFMYDNFDLNIMFTDRDLNNICNEMGWELSEKGIKIHQLEKENGQLKQQIHYLKIVCRNELDDETLKQVMGSLGDLE